MVTVYIWDSDFHADSWGHASMKIEDGDAAGVIYISYWPQGSGRVKQWGSEKNYCVEPIPNRTFEADVKGEDGRQPDHTVRLEGLDEAAMRKWWTNLQSDSEARWCTLSQNCSTAVVQGLRAGGAENWYANPVKLNQMVWTPQVVLHYATAVQRGLLNADQKRTAPKRTGRTVGGQQLDAPIRQRQ